MADESPRRGEKEDVNETVVFDNLQSQDDPVDDDEGLKGPLDFVLDDCPFGSGVMSVVKSMCKGEKCEAWLDPKLGPGKTTPLTKRILYTRTSKYVVGSLHKGQRCEVTAGIKKTQRQGMKGGLLTGRPLML